MDIETVNLNEDEIEFYEFLKRYKNDEDILLTNLLINKQYKGANQLDFVIINKKGIFVIERKNYNGRIYGYENSKNWKVYYENSEQYDFYNPIKQNYSHVNTIQFVLTQRNLEKIPIYNIVVFNENADIRKITTSNIVVKESDFFDTIEAFPTTNLNQDILLSVRDAISDKNVQNKENLDKHIEDVNSYSSNNDSNYDSSGGCITFIICIIVVFFIVISLMFS